MIEKQGFTPRLRQRSKQKRFQAAVERLGYDYLIMRSVDDARRYIETIKRGGGSD